MGRAGAGTLRGMRAALRLVTGGLVAGRRGRDVAVDATRSWLE